MYIPAHEVISGIDTRNFVEIVFHVSTGDTVFPFWCKRKDVFKNMESFPDINEASTHLLLNEDDIRDSSMERSLSLYN